MGDLLFVRQRGICLEKMVIYTLLILSFAVTVGFDPVVGDETDRFRASLFKKIHSDDPGISSHAMFNMGSAIGAADRAIISAPACGIPFRWPGNRRTRFMPPRAQFFSFWGCPR